MIQPHPLDLPEIRQHLSLFLSIQDCLSCTRVCKAWSRDFVYRIWKDIRISNAAPTSAISYADVQKYGNLVKYLSLYGAPESTAVKWTPCSELVKFDSSHYSSGPSNIIWEIVQRNVGTLQELKMQSILGPHSAPVLEVESILPHSGDSLVSKGKELSFGVSRLTILHLWGFKTTQEDFGMLLQKCPSLSAIVLNYMIIVDSGFKKLYPHLGITRIEGSPTALCDSLNTKTTTFMDHFPKIKHFDMNPNPDWSASSLQGPFQDQSPVPVPEAMLRRLSKMFPVLDSVAMHSSRRYDFNGILTKGFSGLKSIQYMAKEYEVGIAKAVFKHVGTLESIILDWIHPGDAGYYGDNGDSSKNEYDQIEVQEEPVSQAQIQMMVLPLLCKRLKVFWAPNLEFDVYGLEARPWVCLGLETMGMNFKYLDTLWKIKRVIRAYRAMKKVMIEMGEWFMDEETVLRGKGIGMDRYAVLMEDRIVRYLLRFRHLKLISLGYYDFEV